MHGVAAVQSEGRRAQPAAGAPTDRGVTEIPPTRYTKSDGVNIAYQVWGDGPIDLVFVPPWLSHLDLDAESSVYRPFVDGLAGFCRVIRFDKRGMGLSDRDAATAPLEVRMDDVNAVMEAAGSSRAALLGFSDGGQMTMLFAATYPDRVSALILCDTAAWYADEPQVRELYEIIENHWGEGRLIRYLSPALASEEKWREAGGRYERAAASPGAARRSLDNQAQIDLRPVLGALRVPTLVIHVDGDTMVAVELGRELARAIPGARYHEVHGDSHYPWFADLSGTLAEIQEFLTGSRQRIDTDRVLATILFTDVVGSTELAVMLGDREWRALRDEHHRLVREQLELFRGREIDTAGDGFCVTFDGPARAVRCACAIRDAVRALGLEIRAGLHTGEIELAGRGIAGIAVHTAARIAAAAAPGQVLVSRTLTDLVVGSGLEFAEAGRFELKGVPARFELLTVHDGAPAEPHSSPAASGPV